MRVLLVEDDPALAEYAGAVLRRHEGITVDIVSDGPTALDSFRSVGADIVITDGKLSGMTGSELAAQIRYFDPAMPLAMMTAHASVDAEITAARRHVDEFLVKPITECQLRSTLGALIGLRRERDAAAVHPVVLAIGAHPEDVEIGVGGLLAAHRAAGDPVVILTLSRGGHGPDAERRRDASRTAAELIGARLFLADLEDTKISTNGPTVATIERVVAEVSPTIVYTHSRHDLQQDHRAVHQAVYVATRRVPTTACYQSPSATLDFHPDRFVPIDGFTDTKLALLGCFAGDPGARDGIDPGFVLATARYWSRFGQGESCEPLEVIRDARDLIGQLATVRETRFDAEPRCSELLRQMLSPTLPDYALGRLQANVGSPVAAAPW